MIMPQFAYKKGQLHIASRKIEDLFIDRGLNDGHLIVPTNVKAGDFMFRNVPLLQGRTDMAEMMLGRKMKAIEDVSAGGACDHRLGWHSEGIGRRLNYAPNTLLQDTL